MAKIHPNPSKSCSRSSSSEREVFTLWMKSLVFHGNGCTVFDSRGEVVFRVDNYQKRCSSEVLLMDSSGKVLFSINRKKLGIFECWEGFNNEKTPSFQVRRNHTILSKDVTCRVTLNCEENNDSPYTMIGLEGKSAFKVMDFSGHLLAEAAQKQSSGGVPLGEDVLTLTVEPQADQSLVMALVTVYGLINNRL